MSDEEEDMQEEEVEAEEAPKQEEEAPAEEEEEAPVKQEEEKPKPKPPPPRPKPEEGEEVKEMSEAEKALQAQRRKHDEEEALKLKGYEEQRRIEREKEEEELRQLKEKQERRKLEREEEERIMAERRREEEDRRKQEEDARKAKAEADKARKEEEKKKKAAMMAGLQTTGPQLTVQKKDKAQIDKSGQIIKPTKVELETKEQHEEHKKAFMKNILVEPNLAQYDIEGLRKFVRGLHARICKLEGLKYDSEKRFERQEYDLKELNERQRQMQRNKALQKGLDPEEAASSLHPPKLPTASKYDRQIDRRSYGDRRVLFASDKTPKKKSIFHGSARPPNEWGRHENEELEQIRKNMEPPKYVETVKVEGAKPPMAPIPVQMPSADEEPPAEPAPAQA